MDDVAAAESSESRWRLKKKNVLNVTRRVYHFGRASYASGSTACDVNVCEASRGEGVGEQITRISIRNECSSWCVLKESKKRSQTRKASE